MHQNTNHQSGIIMKETQTGDVADSRQVASKPKYKFLFTGGRLITS